MIFFKDLAEIKKKEKDKTVFENRLKPVMEVKRMVLKVQGCGLSDFGV